MPKRPFLTQELNAVRGAVAAMKFRDVLHLPSLTQKREQMLDRCEYVYDLAEQRTRPMKTGEAHDPDCHSMLKAVELACVIMGINKEQEVGDSERRETDIQRIIGLLNTAGWEVTRKAS